MRHLGALAHLLCDSRSRSGSTSGCKSQSRVSFNDGGASRNSYGAQRFTGQDPYAFSHSRCRRTETPASCSSGALLTLAEALALDPGGI